MFPGLSPFVGEVWCGQQDSEGNWSALNFGTRSNFYESLNPIRGLDSHCNEFTLSQLGGLHTMASECRSEKKYKNFVVLMSLILLS